MICISDFGLMSCGTRCSRLATRRSVAAGGGSHHLTVVVRVPFFHYLTSYYILQGFTLKINTHTHSHPMVADGGTWWWWPSRNSGLMKPKAG